MKDQRCQICGAAVITEYGTPTEPDEWIHRFQAVHSRVVDAADSRPHNCVAKDIYAQGRRLRAAVAA